MIDWRLTIGWWLWAAVILATPPPTAAWALSYQFSIFTIYHHLKHDLRGALIHLLDDRIFTKPTDGSVSHMIMVWVF